MTRTEISYATARKLLIPWITARLPPFGFFWTSKEAVIYHTSGDFPIKLHFFTQNDAYEVIYIGLEREILISHVLNGLPADDTNRLVILESEQQASRLSLDEVTAYCLVIPDGTVNYYQKA